MDLVKKHEGRSYSASNELTRDECPHLRFVLLGERSNPRAIQSAIKTQYSRISTNGRNHMTSGLTARFGKMRERIPKRGSVLVTQSARVQGLQNAGMDYRQISTTS